MDKQFDNGKLRGRVYEKYKSISNFAKKLNKNRSTVSAMLNGKIKIKREDIVDFCNLLDISEEEIVNYFF